MVRRPGGPATNWRLDLSVIAPGRWAARMPGTGTLRRSSAPARIKAIVGKSRVAATRLQRLSVVFLILAMIGCTFLDLHGKESLTKANGKLGGRQFPSNRGILPFFGDVAQDQIDQLSGCFIARKMASGRFTSLFSTRSSFLVTSIFNLWL